MKRKVLAAVMAALMVLSLAGCGGSSGSGASASAETIKIGGIGPLTGSYANYGLSASQGAKIAVDEINAAGGISGKQIELKYEDSQGDPESAVNAYGKLMDWGMQLSLGGVFSGETASIVAAAKEDDILLLTPSGSADAILDGNDRAFRICFYDSFQGAAAAQYIYDNKMADEVSIFYESDYDYSVGLYNSFVEKCGELGIKIVETQTFTTGTNTDFSAQISKLAAAGSRVIFIPIYAEEASTFLTQAQGKFSDDVFFFGADGLDGILGKVEQDPSIANNVLMLTPFAADSEDAKVKAFVAKYTEAYKAAPDQFAADGYDAIYTLKAAVEKAGSTSGDALKKAMVELTVEGVTGKMTWTADGNTNKPASAILYYDGVGSLYAK